jgi:hypothetical protein
MVLFAAAATVVLVDFFVHRPKRLSAESSSFKTLESQVGLLETRTIEQTEALRAEIRLLRRSLEGKPPPESAKAAPDVVKERLDDLSAEIYDLRRETEKNLQLMLKHILGKLAEVTAPRAASDEEMKAAKRNLIDALKKDGVLIQESGTALEVKARFAHPTRVLELLASTEGGRLHESLFVVESKPSSLMSGLIALGLDPEHGAAASDTGAPPKGDPVYIYVLFPGRKTPVRAEDCILNREKNEAMERGPWVFTGSGFYIHMGTGKQYFLADTNAIAVSICHNWSGTAVIASPKPETANEYIWEPNDLVLPKERDQELTMYFTKQPRPEWDKP